MPGFYTSDLTTLFTGDTAVTTVESTTTGYTNTGALNGSDPDIYLQGTASLSASSGTSKTGVCTLLYDRGTALQITNGNVLAMWTVWPVPSGLGTFNSAVGGVILLTGTGTAALDSFVVNGSDTDPIGGWQQYVVDLRNTPTGALTGGSATETNRYYGIGYEQVVTFSRAQLFAIDVTRYGRMTFSATQGTNTSVNYATPLTSTSANFPQMAYYDEWNGGTNPTLSGTSIGASKDGGFHKLGHIQLSNGVFICKGIISLGTAAAAVYFDDANRTVNFKDEFLTYNDFNRLEFRNSGSTIKMDAMSFNFVPRSSIILAADAPATPLCNVELYDSPKVYITGTTFTDMGTFTLGQGDVTSYIDASTFRRCQTVYPKGMAITDTAFINTSSANGAVQFDSVADSANMSNCHFENNTVGPAIKITAAGTYTFSGHQFVANTWQVEFTGSGSCIIIPAAGSNVNSPGVRSTGPGTITVQAPAVNVIITGLQVNSEVRAYVGTDPATSTAIGGVENSSTSFTFSQSVGGQDGYIVIHALGYNTIYLPITYSSTEQTIPIQQTVDRNYSNP